MTEKDAYLIRAAAFDKLGLEASFELIGPIPLIKLRDKNGYIVCDKLFKSTAKLEDILEWISSLE